MIRSNKLGTMSKFELGTQSTLSLTTYCFSSRSFIDKTMIDFSFLKTFLYNICSFVFCIYRDFVALRFFLKSKKKFNQFERDNLTVADIFRRLVKKHPNKAYIIFESQTWTYKNVEDYSNRIAHLFLKKYKLSKGDSVALFLENKPEYMGILLGLSKIGVITALINVSLRAESLLHSIHVTKAKILIFDSSLESGKLLSFLFLTKKFISF
jgi:hypothetical protein